MSFFFFFFKYVLTIILTAPLAVEQELSLLGSEAVNRVEGAFQAEETAGVKSPEGGKKWHGLAEK